METKTILIDENNFWTILRIWEGKQIELLFIPNFEFKDFIWDKVNVNILKKELELRFQDLNNFIDNENKKCQK